MQVVQRDARPTAVVRKQTTWAEFPSEWKPMLDEVYDAIHKWCAREALLL